MSSYIPLVVGSVAVAYLTVRLVSRLAPKKPASPPPAVSPPILILFASQTGTAEGFAQQLVADCRTLKLPCILKSLDDAVDLLTANFSDFALVVILASTYGEGDAPDNGGLFDRSLTQSQSAGLPRVSPNFAVCGLGSSEYREFNAFGKRLSAGLRRLGFAQLLDLGVCDDAKDSEGAFAEWRLEFWRRATKDKTQLRLLGGLGENLTEGGDLELVSGERKIDLPFDATIVNGGTDVISRFYFTSFGSVVVAAWTVIRPRTDKFVVHVELDISKVPALRYKTGDTLEVLPVNRPDLVQTVLDLFVRSDQPSPGNRWLQFKKKPQADPRMHARKIFPTPVKIKQALEIYCDLQGKPSKTLIRELATRVGKTEDTIDSIIATVQANKYTNIVDLVKTHLEDLPSKVTLEEFILLCPRLKPRSFSISSSSVESPGKIALTVGLEADGHFTGLTSGFLCERIVVGQVLPHVYVRQGIFRLPSVPAAPIIMICAGTGFAPFRGFLCELRVRPRPAPKLLFYGLQSSEVDLLYPQEISDFKDQGGFVFLAESRREGQSKRYVQAELADQQSLVEALISRDAHIYVCGSTKMCQAVFTVLETFAGFVALKGKGKYVEEAWG